MKKWLGLFLVMFLLSGCQKDSGETSDLSEKVLPASSPSVSQEPAAQKVTAEDLEASVSATVKTAKGSFTILFYPQGAPNTVANYLEKFKSGYYKGLTFHRVENWVVQGGDPKGNGTGGGNIATELNDLPFGQWSVGVARGPDIKVSNDSQFFICKKDCAFLTGQYTNLGKVTAGTDVIDSLAIGDKILEIVVED
ncbi:MAG: peptidylprolyl isomerase [bacterium]|nr:peptidylprolyl isomerase [bacterium]